MDESEKIVLCQTIAREPLVQEPSNVAIRQGVSLPKLSYLLKRLGIILTTLVLTTSNEEPTEIEQKSRLLRWEATIELRQVCRLKTLSGAMSDKIYKIDEFSTFRRGDQTNGRQQQRAR
jgi:hypothetical protein